MEKITHKDWAKFITSLFELPNNITNEWIDALDKDTADMFNRWGLCYRDLSKHDLSQLDKQHIEKLTFNSSTVFPSADKMPKGFSPDEIIERGKDPMLGIKQLHKKGIDGNGVTVAVIDFGFQSEKHIEYKGSNITVVDLFGDTRTHFHSDGVLSNLCGQNIGTAPKANVIHYNTYQGAGEKVTDAQVKILQDILKKVENGEKIKAVNISGPLIRSEKLMNCKKEDYEIIKAELIKPLTPILQQLQSLGCEVIDSERFGQDFTCCDIDYKRPEWFKDKKAHGEKVSFICGGKVIPEFPSINGYQYENTSCYSWAIPQSVGMYALALQQNPKLTWNEFAQICKSTSRMTKSGVRIAQWRRVLDSNQ